MANNLNTTTKADPLVTAVRYYIAALHTLNTAPCNERGDIDDHPAHEICWNAKRKIVRSKVTTLAGLKAVLEYIASDDQGLIDDAGERLLNRAIAFLSRVDKLEPPR